MQDEATLAQEKFIRLEKFTQGVGTFAQLHESNVLRVPRICVFV